MAIPRPDEYVHQNLDLAFADSDFVRGGRRTVASRAALYALASKADQLKESVTIVRVRSDGDNGGVATELLLVDATKIGIPAGWALYATGGSPSTGAPSGFEVRAYSPTQVVIKVPAGTVLSDLQMQLVPKSPKPASYDAPALDASNPTANGINFLPAGPQKLEINEIAGTSGATRSFSLVDSSDGSTSQVDVASDYQGKWFRFTRANGTTIEFTLPATAQTITL